MYKVMCIFGTRPEAIKMAPVIHAIEQHPQLQGIVCISAQHREMLDSVLETFKIKPDHDLNIMKHGQTLHSITCDILERLTPVLQDEKPDMILVHGDTTTTFAAALAAFYQQIAIGHVEAGLRTYHKYSPYPEEMNRQLVSRMADLHFAPTATSRDNLLQEHIREEQIIVTGNTAIDALKLTECEAYDHEALRWADGHRILLLTAHRRENQGQGLRQIYAAVRTLCETYPDIRVIYPCHMNPNIRKLAHECLDGCSQVLISEPMEVYDFHNLIRHAYLILSDSGGIQEEAPSLGKPVLVLRDTTERPEGIAAGTLKLVGTDTDSIVRETSILLDDQHASACRHQLAVRFLHAVFHSCFLLVGFRSRFLRICCLRLFLRDQAGMQIIQLLQDDASHIEQQRKAQIQVRLGDHVLDSLRKIRTDVHPLIRVIL